MPLLAAGETAGLILLLLLEAAGALAGALLEMAGTGCEAAGTGAD